MCSHILLSASSALHSNELYLLGEVFIHTNIALFCNSLSNPPEVTNLQSACIDCCIVFQKVILDKANETCLHYDN